MAFLPLLNSIHEYTATESAILKEHQELIKGVIKPALLMHVEQSVEGVYDSKKSKIGGKPKVNDEMAEFLKQNKDYVLVFQLDFKDIKDYSEELGMPDQGLISVFINTISKNNKACLDLYHIKCFFNNDANELYHSYDPAFIIQQSEFTFKELLTIPWYDDDVWQEMEDNYDDFGFEVYEQLTDKIMEVCTLMGYNVSHVGGHNHPVQASVLYDFAALDLIDEPLYSKAFYDKYKGFWKEIESLSNEYVLICQVDTSTSNFNLSKYLDCVMYLGLRKDELKNKDFSNLKFITQNT